MQTFEFNQSWVGGRLAKVNILCFNNLMPRNLFGKTRYAPTLQPLIILYQNSDVSNKQIEIP